MFKWPGAYLWHDGHTDHHFMGSAPGGVLLKHDSPAPVGAVSHPHTDGAIPGGDESKRAANDQAAGKGVATYRKFALPFGHIQDGPSNLFHYDYRGKNAEASKLVGDHGFSTYYAGGKFGKPDLSKRNYNTKHLMVYDPTDADASFGDPHYTDTWRKVHELSHALTYPELNATYGEGRRIGKLGHHRTLKEALRAVHWEWLAAHKQRELNKQIGIHVPEETFNRELNTVMHDAAHRAVTGKFTEPSQEGFVPHAHKVPLETSLNLVREAARNLGLKGDNDLIAKSEGNANVADKYLTVNDALRFLHINLQERIDGFAKSALELRKKESEALAKNLRKDDVGNQDPMAGESDLGGAGRENDMSMKEKNMKKMMGGAGAGGAGQVAGSASAPASLKGVGGLSMSELAKHGAMCKCDGCSKMEKYAKGELAMNKATKEEDDQWEADKVQAQLDSKKPVKKATKEEDDQWEADKVQAQLDSKKPVKKATKEEDDQWEADKVQAQLDSKKQKKVSPYGKSEHKPAPGCCNAEGCTKKASGEFCAAHKPQETKKAQPNTFVKNPVRDGAKVPPEEGGKEITPTRHAEGGNDGLNKEKGKSIAKAAMAGSAIPPPPPTMKPMKLPGMGMPKPAAGGMPKPAGAGAAAGGMPKAPKPPAMGAGTPSPVGKAELAKAGPVSLGRRSMEARKQFGQRTMAAQEAKRPAVAASAGHLMDSMLGAPAKTPSPAQATPLAPGSTLPGPPMGGPAHPALAAVGQPIARPAQGVKTMAERVAAKVPAGPSALGMPPAGAQAKIPGVPPKAAAAVPPKLPGMGHTMKSEMKKSERALRCLFCKKSEHGGNCR